MGAAPRIPGRITVLARPDLQAQEHGKHETTSLARSWTSLLENGGPCFQSQAASTAQKFLRVECSCGPSFVVVCRLSGFLLNILERHTAVPSLLQLDVRNLSSNFLTTAAATRACLFEGCGFEQIFSCPLSLRCKTRREARRQTTLGMLRASTSGAFAA